MDDGARQGIGETLDWRDANREAVGLGLEWLARRLRTEVERLRRGAPAPGPDGGVDDLAADWLLRDLIASGAQDEAGGPPGEECPARRAYEARRAEMAGAGAPAAIDRLSRLFGLSPFEEDVLLLALAPRAEAGFHPLFAYLHDRAALSWPTRGLALTLFAGARSDWSARCMGERRLCADAPLRRWRLIEMRDEGRGALARIEMDERIADLLLGCDRMDPRAMARARAVVPTAAPPSAQSRIAAFAGALDPVCPKALVLGRPGSGRLAAAAALAAAHGLGLMTLRRDCPQDAAAAPDDPDGFALLAREARLGGFAWMIDLERGSGEAPSCAAARLAVRALEGLDAPVFVTAGDRPDGAEAARALTLAPLSDADRAALWREALGVAAPDAVEAAAAQFRIGPQAVARIAADVGRAVAEQTGAAPGDDALWRACRAACAPALAGLAERIEPRFGWNDLVLPESVETELRALAGQVRSRATVLGRWGFGRRWRDAGASALFAGPSGTGKSMAAEVIAADLGLDLYRIDLSGVVSKYIGETEKNLRRIFEAAEASGAVLLFDEADAIFGKRSDVKDSHDRYANIEVSYLLQSMERYRGLAILASNLKNHIDAAFHRRLSYVIDFPKPDCAARARIWRLALPDAAPLAGVDVERLARMDLTGGSIMRVALNGAYLAADAGEAVSMAHLLSAAAAEHRKIDREFRAP